MHVLWVQIVQQFYKYNTIYVKNLLYILVLHMYSNTNI